MAVFFSCCVMPEQADKIREAKASKAVPEIRISG
jgi:hypothetical protein